MFPQAALNVVYNIPGRKHRVVEPVVPVQVVDTPQVTAKVEPKPFVPVVSPVPDFTGRAGQLQKDNPVLAHISEYKPYDRTRILRKEKEALYVHFELGKSILHADFRENKPILDRIVDITRQERLAQNRALALQRYLQQQVSVPDSMFDTVGGGEAWAEFRDQLNDEIAAGNTSLQPAIDIIDSEGNLDVRERKLRQLGKGRTWQYLKEHILKDQRNSGYIRIYYDYVPDKAAATINAASELLGKGQYAQALQMLNTVRTDERCLNALGVALWQTGQKEEALRCFRRAVANDNADAQENLKQLTN